MSTCWKVVRRLGTGELVSVSTPQPGWCVTYKPGVWAEAPIGCLFAFSEKEQAKNWAKRMRTWGWTEVWLAEAEDVKPMDVICLTQNGFYAFWTRERPRVPLVRAPEGTVAAKRLKLIEKVWP